jgi:hypothetical protein
MFRSLIRAGILPILAVLFLASAGAVSARASGEATENGIDGSVQVVRYQSVPGKVTASPQASAQTPLAITPTPTTTAAPAPQAPVQMVQAPQIQYVQAAPVQYVQAAPVQAQPVQMVQAAPVQHVQMVQAAPVQQVQMVQMVQAVPVQAVQAIPVQLVVPVKKCCLKRHCLFHRH